MLTIKIELELDEEELKDIFESYDIKFTKKKLTEIKKAIKECELDFSYELEGEIKDVLSNFISEQFGE